MKYLGEQHIKKGCIVVIKSKPKKSKLRGFKVGSEHIIQKPPKGYINSLMSVFLKGKDSKLYQIPFNCFQTTAKKK